MGWIVHHAIIVTTCGQDDITRAHAEAVRVFQDQVTPPVESAINGYWSFLIVPDGSKEGWPDSAAGDKRRKRFRHWARAQAYEDGSNPYDVIEVAYREVKAPVIVSVDGHKTGATITGLL